MPELREVDSDLMLAAGLEAAFDQRRARQPPDRCDVRHRPFRRRHSVLAWSASVSLLPGASATQSIPAGLSTTTTSLSKNRIALRASGSARSLGADSSTTTTASDETREAGSTRRSPSTLT